MIGESRVRVLALVLALGVLACSLPVGLTASEPEGDVAATRIAQTVEAGVQATNVAQTVEAGVAATQASLLPAATPLPDAAPAGGTITVNMASTEGKTLDDGWDNVFSQVAEIPAEDIPPDGVPFTLIVSEAQIEGHFAAFTEVLFIQDFGVRLDDGLITLTFNVVVEELSQPGSIVLLPSIDAAGDLAFEVQSATMGQVSLPPESTDALTQSLNEALSGRREEAEFDVTLGSLSVADGQMVIGGTVRPKAVSA